MNEFSNIDLLIIDDFLTIGIDSYAASDLFAILANREHRLPTMIVFQTGPAHWVAELPDRVAADSIVNRLVRIALPPAWVDATVKRYSPVLFRSVRRRHL